MQALPFDFAEWQSSSIQAFWNEIADGDHLVQVYDNDSILLSTLEGFAATGFLANETVIVIATTDHLALLEERLYHQGFDMTKLIANDQYITMNSEDLLSEFLVDRSIDESRFKIIVSDLIKRLKKQNRKIRLFGETVALLWEKGFYTATVQLEQLWNEFLEVNSFTVFCAYSKTGFKRPLQNSVHTICQKHSKVIDGKANPSTEIYYQCKL